MAAPLRRRVWWFVYPLTGLVLAVSGLCLGGAVAYLVMAAPDVPVGQWRRLPDPPRPAGRPSARAPGSPGSGCSPASAPAPSRDPWTSPPSSDTHPRFRAWRSRRPYPSAVSPREWTPSGRQFARDGWTARSSAPAAGGPVRRCSSGRSACRCAWLPCARNARRCTPTTPRVPRGRRRSCCASRSPGSGRRRMAPAAGLSPSCRSARPCARASPQPSRTS